MIGPKRFRDSGVFTVSLVSSPGSGKTAFLEKTLAMLRTRYRVAALVEKAGIDADKVQHLGRPRFDAISGHVLVRADRVCELGTDALHRVERVHGALHDDGDLRPAEHPQFVLPGGEQVDGVSLVGVVADITPGDQAGRAEQPGDRIGQR